MTQEIETRKTIREILDAHEAKTLTDLDYEDLWYDWFCSEKSLVNKAKSILTKLKSIRNTTKFDIDKCSLTLKNNCPCYGNLYDDVRIFSIDPEHPQYDNNMFVIAPRSGYDSDKKDYKEGRISGLATVYDNSKSEQAMIGSWKEVKEYFLK